MASIFCIRRGVRTRETGCGEDGIGAHSAAKHAFLPQQYLQCCPGVPLGAALKVDVSLVRPHGALGGVGALGGLLVEAVQVVVLLGLLQSTAAGVAERPPVELLQLVGQLGELSNVVALRRMQREGGFDALLNAPTCKRHSPNV